MKYAAIFMCLLVAAGFALGIYTYANARLTLVSVSVSTAQGVEKAAEVAALQKAVDHNALAGTAYVDSLPGSSLDYKFETYSFRLKNGGLIDAEMVEVEPVPVEGDKLSYTALDPAQANVNATVPARGEQTVRCVVLSDAGQDELLRRQRQFRVTYYLWGVAKTMTVGYRD